jgi:hypothetical protein
MKKTWVELLREDLVRINKAKGVRRQQINKGIDALRELEEESEKIIEELAEKGEDYAND